MTDNQQKVLYEVVPENEITDGMKKPDDWLYVVAPLEPDTYYLRPAHSAPAGEREEITPQDFYDKQEPSFKQVNPDKGTFVIGWHCALSQLTTPPTGKAAGDEGRVAEILSEEDGIWSSCSGCHETVDGQETGHYPYSDVFKCHPGSGCRECGGIGVVWEYGLNEAYNTKSAKTPTKAAGVWVKASESVPDEYGKAHWRDAETKLPIKAGGAYTYIKIGRKDLIKWLDESAQPSETGEGKKEGEQMTPEQRSIINTCLHAAISKAKLGSTIYNKNTVDFAVAYFESQK